MVVVTFGCRSVKKCTGGDSPLRKKRPGRLIRAANVKNQTTRRWFRVTGGLLSSLLLATAPGMAQSPNPGSPSLPSREGGPKARVVVVHDANATEAFSPNPVRVIAMVNQGITNLTGKPTPMAAWLSLVST